MMRASSGQPPFLKSHQARTAGFRLPLRDCRPPRFITGVEPSSTSTINCINRRHDGDARGRAVQVAVPAFGERKSAGDVMASNPSQDPDGPGVRVVLHRSPLRIITLGERPAFGGLQIAHHQLETAVRELVGHGSKLFRLSLIKPPGHSVQFAGSGEKFHRDLQCGASICIHWVTSLSVSTRGKIADASVAVIGKDRGRFPCPC